MDKRYQIRLGVFLAILLIAGVLAYFLSVNLYKKPAVAVSNFNECVSQGNPIMESYPRRCRAGNMTFTEDIGNELQKTDLIRLDSPRPGGIITSPLTITGQARGTWFFEASFPVILTDWDGKIIAQGIAQAKGDWMTTDFVPFEAALTFSIDPQAYSNKGTLILKKDNPSGLPQNDDALEIPVLLQALIK